MSGTGLGISAAAASGRIGSRSSSNRRRAGTSSSLPSSTAMAAASGTTAAGKSANTTGTAANVATFEDISTPGLGWNTLPRYSRGVLHGNWVEDRAESSSSSPTLNNNRGQDHPNRLQRPTTAAATFVNYGGSGRGGRGGRGGRRGGRGGRRDNDGAKDLVAVKKELVRPRTAAAATATAERKAASASTYNSTYGTAACTNANFNFNPWASTYAASYASRPASPPRKWRLGRWVPEPADLEASDAAAASVGFNANHNSGGGDGAVDDAGTGFTGTGFGAADSVVARARARARANEPSSASNPWASTQSLSYTAATHAQARTTGGFEPHSRFARTQGFSNAQRVGGTLYRGGRF